MESDEIGYSCTDFNMNHVTDSRENPYANNKGADQPAHFHSLISAFVVRCLNSIISILAKFKVSRL